MVPIRLRVLAELLPRSCGMSACFTEKMELRPLRVQLHCNSEYNNIILHLYKEVKRKLLFFDYWRKPLHISAERSSSFTRNGLNLSDGRSKRFG